MLINDNELLQEFVDFLMESENTYVEDAKTDYFAMLNSFAPASFTEWLGKLVNIALHEDKFTSALPGWQDVDLTEDGYESILLRSLLNNPSFKADLLEEYEYLEETWLG